MWNKEMASLQFELSHVIQVLLFVQTSSHIQSMKSASNSIISCLQCSQGYSYSSICCCIVHNSMFSLLYVFFCAFNLLNFCLHCSHEYIMADRKARDLLNIPRTGGHCRILRGQMQKILLHNN